MDHAPVSLGDDFESRRAAVSGDDGVAKPAGLCRVARRWLRAASFIMPAGDRSGFGGDGPVRQPRR